MKKSFVVLLCIQSALLLISGCSGAPALDTSSDAAMEASVKAMSAKLPEDQQKALAGSLGMIIAREGMKASTGQAKPAGSIAELLKPWHGKTAEEIIKEGKTIGQPL